MREDSAVVRPRASHLKTGASCLSSLVLDINHLLEREWPETMDGAIHVVRRVITFGFDKSLESCRFYHPAVPCVTHTTCSLLTLCKMPSNTTECQILVVNRTQNILTISLAAITRVKRWMDDESEEVKSTGV